MVQKESQTRNGTVAEESTEEQYILHGPDQPAIENLRSVGEEIYDKMLEHGDKIALVDGDDDSSISFAALSSRAVSVALALRDRGVTTGDIVSLVELTALDSFAVILGTLLNGATINMLDGTWAVANTVPSLMPKLKPRVVFTHASVFEKVKDVIGQNPEAFYNTELVVYGTKEDKEYPGAKTFEQFVVKDQERVEKFRPTVVEDTAKSASLILCTSGSTGTPKGVMLSHKNIANMIVGAGLFFPGTATIFNQAPCYWSSGIFMLLIGMYTGCKKIFTKKPFSETNVLGLLQKYKVNIAFLSSFQTSLINHHPKIDSYDLSSVRLLIVGGSRLPEKQISEMQARLKQGLLGFGYGMTEIVGGTGMNPTFKPKLGSVGTLGGGLSLKVVDLETGRNVGPNQSGELYLRGPTMIGYYDNPEETRKVLDPRTGWLRTGDIGHYDEEGYVFITDRLKEIAKYRGYYIAPADIEDVLYAHTNVNSCAVVTIPYEDACDLVVAFVDLKQGATDTAEELEDTFNEQLEDYQKLRGGVYILDKIPVLAHGKVARPALKQKARDMSDDVVKHYKTKYCNAQ